MRQAAEVVASLVQPADSFELAGLFFKFGDANDYVSHLDSWIDHLSI
jgi:hypothetical protein